MSNVPNPVDQLKATVTQPATTVAASVAKPVETKTIDPDYAKLIADVMDLQKQVKAGNTAKAAAIAQAAPPEIDWTRVTEADITNLDLTIPVIEQECPEFMNVVLKDKNYVTRWIHQMPQRLGVALSSGYSYVKAEDFDERFPRFLNFDTSGNYSHGDVVCLKILKSRYYPALKANYMKTMAIHGRSKMQEAIRTGRSGVQLDRQGEPIIRTNEQVPDVLDPRSLGVYDPGDEPAKGERVWTRDMVS